MRRMKNSSHYTKNDVVHIEEKTYFVTSDDDNTRLYKLSLGSEIDPVFCECEDFKHYYLPCKHIFAVFHNTKHSWKDMAPAYRDSPCLSLDVSFMTNVSRKLIEEQNASSLTPVEDTQMCNQDPADVSSKCFSSSDVRATKVLNKQQTKSRKSFCCVLRMLSQLSITVQNQTFLRKPYHRQIMCMICCSRVLRKRVGCHYRQPEDIPQVRNLPVRNKTRKKNRLTGRVGEKAERARIGLSSKRGMYFKYYLLFTGRWF